MVGLAGIAVWHAFSATLPRRRDVKKIEPHGVFDSKIHWRDSSDWRNRYRVPQDSGNDTGIVKSVDLFRFTTNRGLMMKVFQCDPAVEVMGLPIRSFVRALPESARELSKGILQKHGLALEEIQPDQFYPFQSYLSAMKDIEELLGTFALSQIGEKVVKDIPFPPQWRTLEDVLENMDLGYQMLHRGGDAGHYIAQPIESEGRMTGAKIICENPHACSFNRGTLIGLANTFETKDGGRVFILHDDSAPCKAKGGESCTFTMQWG